MEKYIRKELDEAIEKLEKFIKLQNKSLCMPIPVNSQQASNHAEYVPYMLKKNNK